MLSISRLLEKNIIIAKWKAEVLSHHEAVTQMLAWVEYDEIQDDFDILWKHFIERRQRHWGGNYGRNSRGAAAELTFNLKTWKFWYFWCCSNL